MQRIHGISTIRINTTEQAEIVKLMLSIWAKNYEAAMALAVGGGNAEIVELILSAHRGRE